MLDTHYAGLFAAYTSLVVATLILGTLWRRSARGAPIWPACERIELDRPWLDVALLLVSIAGVIGVGQLYMRGLLLPSEGALGSVCEAINQALIFSPVALLLVVRRQGPRTAFLPMERFWTRGVAGLGLGVAAGIAYSTATLDPTGLLSSIGAEASSGRLPAHAVQVLMEDLVIAALLVRLAGALRSEWGAGVLVAMLFAAAHVPAMLAGEDPVGTREIVRLSMDALIGVVVMVGLVRTRDVLWLYPTHLLMDIAQF